MIDILLPFYGEPRLLQEAVRSVLAQTSPDWRLVVVDDAYPDADVAVWLQSLDEPRISYHRNATNLGFARNFQRCLELAEAQQVVFLGGDDRLLPRYVEMVGAAARASGAAMVQPGVAVIDEHGNRRSGLTDRVKNALAPGTDGGDRLLGGERLAASLMRGAWTYFPAICWDRAEITKHGFRAEHSLALDVGLIIDLLIDGAEMLVLDQVLFEYRRHEGSASVSAARASDRFAVEARFFAAMRRRLDEAGWSRAARAARLHLTSRLHALSLMPQAARQRDGRTLRALVRHAVR